jgi:hypothetical protein
MDKFKQNGNTLFLKIPKKIYLKLKKLAAASNVPIHKLVLEIIKENLTSQPNREDPSYYDNYDTGVF